MQTILFFEHGLTLSILNTTIVQLYRGAQFYWWWNQRCRNET